VIWTEPSPGTRYGRECYRLWYDQRTVAALRQLGSQWTCSVFWPAGKLIEDLADSPGMPLNVAQRYAEWAVAAVLAGYEPWRVKLWASRYFDARREQRDIFAVRGEHG